MLIEPFGFICADVCNVGSALFEALYKKNIATVKYKQSPDLRDGNRIIDYLYFEGEYEEDTIKIIEVPDAPPYSFTFLLKDIVLLQGTVSSALDLFESVEYKYDTSTYIKMPMIAIREPGTGILRLNKNYGKK